MAKIAKAIELNQYLKGFAALKKNLLLHIRKMNKMAKKKEENEELIVDVQEVYSKTETYIEENKNVLVSIIAGIALVVGGYFAYNSFYLDPLQEEAQQEMFMAEKYFAMDSMNLAIYGNQTFAGFIEIVDNYGSTQAGNLANYYLGVAFLHLGQFEACIDALQDFSTDDEILMSMALGASADAYMELQDLNKAASYYKKAAGASGDEFSTPMYLMKAGKTFELLGAYDEAIEAYTEIKKDYRKSPEAAAVDKFIARAETFVQ